MMFLGAMSVAQAEELVQVVQVPIHTEERYETDVFVDSGSSAVQLLFEDLQLEIFIGDVLVDDVLTVVSEPGTAPGELDISIEVSTDDGTSERRLLKSKLVFTTQDPPPDND